MNYNEKSPENSKTLSKTPDRIKEHSISDIFEQKAVEENDIHINFHSPQLKKKKIRKKSPQRKNNNYVQSKDNNSNTNNKKGVTFKRKFCEIIMVDSYKKYNMDSIQTENIGKNNRQVVKCSCLIM